MRPTVLVIDDDRVTREILSDLLRDAGLHVVLASGGEEGCRLACADPPDVVLVDLCMPDRDGLEVCRFLRSQPGLKEISILLMTAHPDRDSLVNPFRDGFDDYIAKPFDFDELLARIQGALLKKQAFAGCDKKARHYDALLKISETLSENGDAGAALKEIARQISTHLESVDRCSIALVRDAEGCAYVVATTADIRRPTFRIDLKNYPEIRQVMATGRPLLVENVAENPLLAEILPAFEGRDISAVLVFPVIDARRVIGAMIIRIARPGEGVDRDEVGFCRLVSNVVVTAFKSSDFFRLVWEEAEVLRVAKKRLEADLRIKQAYEELFENASEGLMAFSAAGTIAYANRCLVDMVGGSSTSLCGVSLAELFGMDVQERFLTRRIATDDSIGVDGRFDIEFVPKDGEPRTFSVSIGARPVLDGLRVAALRDVTDQRRIEEDLLRVKELLETANAALVRADQARTEFLHTAVHELRTPLTIVSGYCSLLAETDQARLSDEQRVYVEEAVAAADRLADLINNLLDLSRLESGSMPLVVERCDLIATIREFLYDCRPLLETSQLILKTTFPESAVALYDEERIYRVLVNLFGNAVKFTPIGGTIHLFVDETSDAVRFAIEDTGKGIPEEALPRLFEQFYQVERGDSRQGSGLGLYICKKIIESHHGEIQVESRIGRGSRFSFTLPKVDPNY
ncbi:ATP-binding protein [Trichloromonas sp.]|uniref:ATP-binding protein n=1 Tax=Trichloromonas sp. TaxID=3069249 RepID=UPI002A3F80AB|nr:ATP-binding protein [Trichloromonas sp.]